MRVYVLTALLLLSKSITLAAYPSVYFVDHFISIRNVGWSSEFAYVPTSRTVSSNVGSNFSPIGAQAEATNAETTFLSEETTVSQGLPVWLLFKAAEIALCSKDSDNDRLGDCQETNTGLFVSASDTGTDPNNADTDRDGILDGDEVLGTLAGLDLPGMGASPLKKTILMEYDWLSDDTQTWYDSSVAADSNAPHNHRPTAAVAGWVEEAFANAPVNNPTGLQAFKSFRIMDKEDSSQGVMRLPIRTETSLRMCLVTISSQNGQITLLPIESATSTTLFSLTSITTGVQGARGTRSSRVMISS